MGPRRSLPSELLLLAPGTPLREGLDRIVLGHTGGLIVMGNNERLQDISTGGFAIDVPLTATGLRELAKMDGAIVLSADRSRILAAAVHLSPSADFPTQETGTRHRTAERVWQQTGIPVVTASASMGTISLFAGDGRHAVPRPEQLLDVATQAIGVLGAHRERLLDTLEDLTAREVQDNVTLRDLAHVAQRFEMFNRVADETTQHISGLGSDGRLVAMQLRDLTEDLAPLASLLQRDYVPDDSEALVLAGLATLDDHELFDIVLVGRALGLSPTLHLDSPLSPKGYRHLATIPRLPNWVSARVVDRFGTLAALYAASAADLQEVDGVTPPVALQIREGLGHLADRVLNA
ncbi:MAG: DNA integrity scanning diadenylate cyclase DisA [Propioniciclava sp.]